MRLFNLNLYQTVTTKNSWFHLTQSHYQMTEYNSIAYFQITKHSSISLFSNERTQETHQFFFLQETARLPALNFFFFVQETQDSDQFFFVQETQETPHGTEPQQD